ncbi:MAG: ATP phosphoribosyltransferase regulatory subunit, partial [Chloroflexota bacterium]
AQAEFIQAGAELIGAAAPDADGEIISMAWEALRALGVRQPTVTVGHVGMLWELLKPFHLSDRARYFLVRNVSRLREGAEASEEVREEAQTLGLLHPGDGGGQSGGAVVDLPDSNDQEALSLIESVLGYTVGGGEYAPETSRSAGEIVARLARKLTSADDPASVESALGLLSSLARVSGPASEALDECRAVIRAAGHDDGAVDRLAEVVEAAERQGTPAEAMIVEPALARDIAYYTGAIFDLTDNDNARSLGGGGRYDGLLQALGVDVDVPALGFSYDLDAVLAAIGRGAAGPQGRIVLVRPETTEARAAAAEVATSERSTGAVALLEMHERSWEESARYAASCGASEILSVHADGRVDREGV